MNGIEFKFFTIEEANSLLPEIRYLLHLVNSGKDHLIDTILDAQELKGNIAFNGSRKELKKKIEEIIRLGGQMVGLHQTFLGKGLVVRDYDGGVIDFPTIIDGDAGYFCWNINEDRIGHYHLAGDPNTLEITDNLKVLHLKNDDDIRDN